MKVVSLLAVVESEKCNGCSICERVCPVLAVERVERIAVVDADKCSGCGACEQRCPTYAIAMVKRDQPFVVKVDVDAVNYDEVVELCRKAKLNPEQLVCYCTATRAEEVAAAVLQGARSPEDVSLRTGVRTGCKVECIQPVLRLLEAAGIQPEPPKGGWQWYGRTVTPWEIPEELRKRYSSRGFYFDEDIKLLEAVVNAPLQGRSDN